MINFINLFSRCYIKILYLLDRIILNLNHGNKSKDKEHEQIVDDMYRSWQTNWKTYGQ